MAGIKIQFLSDVANFLRGTKNVEESLEDVVDSLEDVSREANNSKAERGINDIGDAAEGTKRELEDVRDGLEDINREGRNSNAERGLSDLEDAAEDAGKEVEDTKEELEDLNKEKLSKVQDELEDTGKASEELERSFRDSMDTLKKESKTAGDSVGSGVKRGMKDAEDSTETFKNEARQNLSESVSSFRGEVEDIPQLVQDVFGGVAADLGPAGMVGGALVAAGIGIGVSFLQGTTEKAAEMKQHLLDLADQIRDVDGDLSKIDLSQLSWDWSQEIGNVKKWWEVWQDADYTHLELAAKAAEEMGISVNEMYRALLDPDSQQAKQLLEDINQRISDLSGTRGLDEEVLALRDMRDALENGSLSMDEANDIYTAYQAAVEGTTVELYEAKEAEEELRESREKSVDASRNLFEAEGDYQEALSNTTETLDENGASLDASTEKGRENRDALLDLITAGEDLAVAQAEGGASVEEVTRTLQDQRESFLDTAEAAGIARGDAADLYDELMGLPGERATDIVADNGPAMDSIHEVENYNPNDVDVPMDVDSSGLQWQADSAARNIRPPVIYARVHIGTRVV